MTTLKYVDVDLLSLSRVKPGPLVYGKTDRSTRQPIVAPPAGTGRSAVVADTYKLDTVGTTICFWAWQEQYKCQGILRVSIRSPHLMVFSPTAANLRSPRGWRTPAAARIGLNTGAIAGAIHPRLEDEP